MRHQLFRIFLFLFLLAFVAPSFAGPPAKESLYDAKGALKIDPALQSVFGPQSGKYRYDKRMLRAAEMAATRMAAARRAGTRDGE